MFEIYDLTVEEAEPPCVLIVFATSAGEIAILGEVAFTRRTIRVRRAHIEAAAENRLGVVGLRKLARYLMEKADAREIVIEGAARTTGANPGHIPRQIRFSR